MTSLTRHTLLLLAVAVALAIPAPAAAQEDILTRYDDAATKALQEEYDAALQDEQEFLKTEPLGSWREDEKIANDLADARFRAILNAQEPPGKEARAKILLEKADSLESLQRFGDESGTNIDSEVYFDAAEGKAEELRREAEVLEAAAAAVPETTEETTAAAPVDGGEEQPVEEPEPTPDEAPEAPVEPSSSGPGFLSGINLVPIAVFVALVAGGIFALSRSGGMSLRGFFSPAIAEVSKKKPRPSKPSPKPTKTTVATTSKPANLEDEPERKKRPEIEPEEDEIPDGPFDSEELREWFEQGMSGPGEEKPDEAGDDDEPPV